MKYRKINFLEQVFTIAAYMHCVLLRLLTEVTLVAGSYNIRLEMLVLAN